MKVLIVTAALLAIAQLVIFTTGETQPCPSCNSTVETVCYIDDTEGRCVSMTDKNQDLCATGDDLCYSIVADQEFGDATGRSLIVDNGAPIRCSDAAACDRSGFITICIGVVYEGESNSNSGYCCQAQNSTSP